MKVFVAVGPGLGYDDEDHYPEGESPVGVFKDEAEAERAAKAAAKKAYEEAKSYDNDYVDPEYADDERYQNYPLSSWESHARVIPFDLK